MAASSLTEKQIDKMVIYALAGYNSIQIAVKMKLPHDPVKETLEFIFTSYSDYIDSLANDLYEVE